LATEKVLPWIKEREREKVMNYIIIGVIKKKRKKKGYIKFNPTMNFV
jgi:hypothetical protein